MLIPFNFLSNFLSAAHTNHHGSSRPAIVFCRHHESNENKSSSGNDNFSQNSGSKGDSEIHEGIDLYGGKYGNDAKAGIKLWVEETDSHKNEWHWELRAGVDNKGTPYAEGSVGWSR